MKSLWVVDDCDDVRDVIIGALCSRYIVRAFPNLATLQTALWSNEKPDCMLVDLNLTDGDFISFYQTHQAILAGIPYLVISGENSPQKIFETAKIGAYDFLAKPFHSWELVSKIDKVLKASHVHIDPIKCHVRVGDKTSKELTLTEYKLMNLMVEKKTVSEDEIKRQLWQTSNVDKRLIGQHMFKLRSKVKDVGIKISQKGNKWSIDC